VSRQLLAAAILAAALVLVAALPDYRARVLVAAVLAGIMASATDLPTGVGGVPLFGAAFPFGIGAYAAGVLASDGNHLSAAFAAAVVIAVGIWFPLTLVAFRLRVTPLQFGLITLLLSIAVEQVIMATPGAVGGSNGLSGIRPAMAFGRSLWPILGCGLGMLGLLFWIRGSEFGLLLRATRDEPIRAEALGYDIPSIRSCAVAIAALFGCFAGVLSASVTGVAYPAMFGLTSNLIVLVWVALGRPGTIVGPLITTVVYRIVQTELGSRFQNHYLFVLGLTIVVSSLWLRGRDRADNATVP
jgi:branched-chain amino acid transport system permease protein